jgi:hypothetical protein
MAPTPDPDRLKERTLLTFVLALLLFASPLTITWASSGGTWLLPYLFWLVIILAGAWVHFRYGRHDL